jgi:hypothetical protein
MGHPNRRRFPARLEDLVIGDATQQGLIGNDFSVATALVAVSCLIPIDVALGQVKNGWPTAERVWTACR